MRKIPFITVVLLLAACKGYQVPDEYTESRQLPHIYPDYVEVTVPANIAPLSMELLVDADDAVTRFSAGGEEIICGGLKARPAINDWTTLTAKAKGQAISVEVYGLKDGQWVRFKPFNIYVSNDSIDPWLSYRMISPSYVSYEELTINQRCLENFDEQVVVDNMLCSTEAGGQCVNCHSYQQYNPERMQFHARHTHGGTFIAYDGQTEKVNLKTDSMLSAGVYPAWHPEMKLIAYSTNTTMQAFHTAHPNKIEVMDAESDLILYDIEAHTVRTIAQAPNEMETFPCWSPDGTYLYFCSAHFEYKNKQGDAEEMALRAREVKYNIYRMAFDLATQQFGSRELVFQADTIAPTAVKGAVGMSATLPRLSPDGRWLLFTMGLWGNFHIWHHDADLWLLDLKSGEARPLDECNSDDTESYHTWSSNGRWIVFSSRRYDGVFTRPFFAHIDEQGHASKPFELPTRDPDRHRQLMKSYNVPELMRGPVKLTPQQIATRMKTEGTPITY